MSAEQIHFVTGRLAEKSLRQTIDRLGRELGFTSTIQVMPITVAALMTPDWIAKRLEIPEGTSRVIVPGYCDDVGPIEERFQVKIQSGPKDLRRLGEFLGGKSEKPVGYGKRNIEIIAEINHAPKLGLEELIEIASSLSAAGADVIDFGCIPGVTFSKIGESISALVNEGLRVSVDSLNPDEIAPAVQAGAELVLSVNSTNREFARDWGTEVVAIPDDFDQFEGIEDTLNILDRHSVPFRIDPILEPIGCGFAKSLQRYQACRNRFPSAEMMMGIGNLTELTDVDSAGVNFLLLGFCEELSINSVLTTQVINWARSSVSECDIARKIVCYAVENKVPPKHVDDQLVMLRDPKLDPHPIVFFEQLATQVKDHNFRIFADGQLLHVIGGLRHFTHHDPFEIFDSMVDAKFSNLDPSHSFYLGYEMCKAMIANQLGKEYQQDQGLNWGHLTVEEKDRHRLKKRSRKID